MKQEPVKNIGRNMEISKRGSTIRTQPGGWEVGKIYTSASKKEVSYFRKRHKSGTYINYQGILTKR